MSVGVLQQYLEDYAAKVSSAEAQGALYNKSLRLDASGNSQLYKQIPASSYNGESGVVDTPATYQQLTKHADGSWYPDGAVVDGIGQSSAVEGQSGIYMARQNGTPQYDSAGNVTGYTYPSAPESLTEADVPTFTNAQMRKLGTPTPAVASTAYMRSADGVIGRFLGRPTEAD